jgi:hypothetical protein
MAHALLRAEFCWPAGGEQDVTSALIKSCEVPLNLKYFGGLML